jgi:hypothetical protein
MVLRTVGAIFVRTSSRVVSAGRAAASRAGMAGTVKPDAVNLRSLNT